MPVSNLLLKNTQNIFQNTSNTRGSRSCNKKGGAGRSVTMKNMNNASNLNMGRGYSPAVNYSGCDKLARPGQAGGVGYGYTKEGAKFNGEVRGGYPVLTKIEKNNQCGGSKKSGCAYKYHPNGLLGGKRRKKTRKQRGRGPCGKPLKKCKCKKGGKKRRKTRRKKKRKSRGGKKRSRKSRGGKKRTRKSRKRRRTRKRMKGGHQYSTSTNYSTPSAQNASGMPWALGPGSFERSSYNCPSSYKH